MNLVAVDGSPFIPSNVTAPKRHPHLALRSKRDARLRLDAPVVRESQAPAARDGGEHEHSFSPCEAFADAAARAAAEGEVCELRTCLLRLRREAQRVERFGVGEEARVAVHDVLA